jgi:hypothetical protein
MTLSTLTKKLEEIGRRSPKHLEAVEAIVNFALQSLDADSVPDPAAYHWKCDDPPRPKKGGV